MCRLSNKVKKFSLFFGSLRDLKNGLELFRSKETNEPEINYARDIVIINVINNRSDFSYCIFIRLIIAL